MLINLSNHISANWSEKQRSAARNAYGEITDWPFPEVDAYASAEQVHALADEIVGKIAAAQQEAVLCQGEFTLTYAIVSRLKERGITAIAASSERNVIETVLLDGWTKKRCPSISSGSGNIKKRTPMIGVHFLLFGSDYFCVITGYKF